MSKCERCGKAVDNGWRFCSYHCERSSIDARTRASWFDEYESKRKALDIAMARVSELEKDAAAVGAALEWAAGHVVVEPVEMIDCAPLYVVHSGAGPLPVIEYGEGPTALAALISAYRARKGTG